MKTENLQEREVTGGSNGYPEPYLGKFISGFKTFEEVEKYAAENDGEIYQIHYKDGWSNCELDGYIYKRPTIYDFMVEGKTWIEEWRKEDQKAYEEENLDWIAEYDGWGNLKTFIHNEDYSKEQAREYFLGKFEDYNIGFNVINQADGRVLDTYEKEECLSYSEDTHNFKIGVYIK